MFELKISLLLNGQTKLKSNLGGFLTILYVSFLCYIIQFVYSDFLVTRIDNQTVFSAITELEFNNSVPQVLASYRKGYDITFNIQDFPNAKNCTKNEATSFLNSSGDYQDDTIYLCLNIKSFVESWKYRYLNFQFASKALKANSSILPELRTQIIIIYKYLNETLLEYSETRTALDVHISFISQMFFFLSRYHIDVSWIWNDVTESTNLGFKMMDNAASNFDYKNGAMNYLIAVEEFYEKRITAKRLPELLSIIMAYISIITYIFYCIAYLSYDFFYLGYVFDNLVPEKELLNFELNKSELKPYLKFYNYILAMTPLQTVALRNLRFIRKICYYHVSIEKILQRYYLSEFDIKNKKLNYKRGLLEKIDFLSESKSLYFNEKESFSNWLSWLITIVSFLFIGASLYLFGRDLITQNNPYVYNKMAFASDIDVNETQRESRFNRIDEPFMITADSTFFESLIPYKFGKETTYFDAMHKCSDDELKALNSTKPEFNKLSMCFKVRDAMSKELFSRSFPRFFIAFARCDSAYNNQFMYAVNDTAKLTLKALHDKCNNKYTSSKKLFDIELTLLHTDFDKSNENLMIQTVVRKSFPDSRINFGVGYVYKTIAFDKDVLSLFSNEIMLEENQLSALGLIFSSSSSSPIFDFSIEFSFYETAVQTTIKQRKIIEVFTQNSVIIGLIFSMMQITHDFLMKW